MCFVGFVFKGLLLVLVLTFRAFRFAFAFLVFIVVVVLVLFFVVMCFFGMVCVRMIEFFLVLLMV